VKRIVTPKYVEHVTVNVYVKDSRISADLSTLSATGKAQKGKKFFVDLLMAWQQLWASITMSILHNLLTGRVPLKIAMDHHVKATLCSGAT
jgi:hypothetical protein